MVSVNCFWIIVGLKRIETIFLSSGWIISLKNFEVKESICTILYDCHSPISIFKYLSIFFFIFCRSCYYLCLNGQNKKEAPPYAKIKVKTDQLSP